MTHDDRILIEDCISMLGRCLDERDFDGLRNLCTEDVTVSTPGGVATGHDAIVEQARQGHSHDDGIQHVITNMLVDVDGDQASVRANLLVCFARTGPEDPQPFLLGEVYRIAVRRTVDGWRIATLGSTPVWSLNLAARQALVSPATRSAS
ncbi:MAG TPA: nuclear transport factor 2 family protein [Mycobacterium sp.]|nr:nuclear transport factor 2 family protein [Mycobacterium sp.]